MVCFRYRDNLDELNAYLSPVSDTFLFPRGVVGCSSYLSQGFKQFKLSRCLSQFVSKFPTSTAKTC